MNRMTITALALLLSNSASAEPDKILVSSHYGDATILALTGPNSDKAAVVFQRQPDDEVETCAREHEGSPSTEIAACVKKALQGGNAPIRTRRAFCSRSTVYMEFGGYSLVGHARLPDVTYGDKTYESYDIQWMCHRTGQVIPNDSADGEPEIMATFKACLSG